MYIHKSLDDPKFLADKKLNLLRNNIITEGQFINLISIDDPYTIIGPAIIDKTKIQQFMLQWQQKADNLVPIQEAFVKKITQNDIINNLQNIVKIFPEIQQLYSELKQKIKLVECPICLKNKYVLLIILKIKELYQDGRNLQDQEQFIKNIINTYFPYANKVINENALNDFDILWIKPDQLIALGDDLIKGLSNCFNCAKKHLSRAKILYEEWHQNYPEHGTLLYNQFIEANKTIEQGYIMFWDSLGQLDMASNQLIGNLINLPESFQIQMINLANEIRQERILFQENSNHVPDFDKLRLNIQKLQNKVNQLNSKKDN